MKVNGSVLLSSGVVVLPLWTRFLCGPAAGSLGGTANPRCREGRILSRQPVRLAAALLVVLVTVLAAGPWPALGAPAGAAVSPAGGRVREGVEPLDPPFRPPERTLLPDEVLAIDRVLAAQAEALRTLDPEAYLATFEQAGPAAPPFGRRAEGGEGLRPDAPLRALRCLFGALPEGTVVHHAQVVPLVRAPGPDGGADVLTLHIVALRGPDRQPELFDMVVLERLRPAPDGSWHVVDWFITEEKEARVSWATWLEGSVVLSPFDRTLAAQMTYSLYPGFPGLGGEVEFDLGESFEVMDVRGPHGSVPWRREGETLRVHLPAAGVADGSPVTVTIIYWGRVEPAPEGNGHLDYFGAEGIYLRPDSGWYPRPEGNGALRGVLTVSVPGWWAAAASGRLVGLSAIDDSRSFSWAVDPPTEVYLAAGPYKTAVLTTARGVTLRTFFSPLGAEHAAAYLRETEKILGFFSEAFGPYPYPNLTLVEVSRFYFSGLSARSLILLDKTWLYDPETEAGPRELLAHEISHQWWGEVVPIREDPEWYLWEGLASYSEALYGEARDGPAELVRLMREKAEAHRPNAVRHPGWSIREANVRTEDWHDSFIYEKGAWVFHMLRFLLGDEAFARLLRSFACDYTGRQPSSADLARLIAEAARESPNRAYLESYIARWVDGTETVDFRLKEVAAAGHSDDGVVLEFVLEDGGDGSFPQVEVCVTCRDGSTFTFLTPGQGRHSVDLPGRPVRIEVDPDFKVLDLRRGNNLYLSVGGLFFSEETLRRVGSCLAAALALAAAGLLHRVRRRRAGPVTAPGPRAPPLTGRREGC